MKWIGLTGGIATGKSTAAGLIRNLEIPVIDADQISRQLSEIGKPGYEQIVTCFGQDILQNDLTIDRKKLAEIVFNNSEFKNRLENILHPLIKNEVQLKKNEYQKNNVSFCFYDVPLLFEKKMEDNFDFTVLIWCDQQTQIERLKVRDNLVDEEIALRFKNQLSMIEKVKKANYCIDNSGVQKDLEKQIKKLVRTLNEDHSLR